MCVLRGILAAGTLCIAAAGCITPHGSMEPPGISNQVRKEIHKLAVRGPSPPSVSLTSELDGKGAAVGKSARAAGLGWLGGTMEAADDAGEGAVLVLAFGLVTAPIAAAGGALYGAAASDTTQAIATGNETLTTVLDFAPDRFRHALAKRFAEGVPVAYEFTGGRSDAELAARGFDAVLDVHMDALVSIPSDNGFHVYFDHANRAELRILGRPEMRQSRTYGERLPSRAVSSWARDGGRQLLAGLDASYSVISARIVDDFFLRKSIQVQGIEPASNGWSIGRISGTVPMFVWTAHDGGRHDVGPDVDYELVLYTGKKMPESGIRTQINHYVPDRPLQRCKRYQWRVRAHYKSFGESTQSDWSPAYRFKTPCK